ncbi:MAG: ABC transporter ATP-binding protein [Promethearchaeota archaeon]
MNAIEVEHIWKIFPGNVQANKDITLHIKEGEVHGLLGENGAGKTTLMNVLYGLIERTSGTIRVRGQEVNFKSPHDAVRYGIGMVHQHFKLIPNLTVTENVIIGAEPMYLNLMANLRVWKPSVNPMMPTDFKGAEREIRRISKENALNIDPRAKIQDLSVGQQQQVEIIKILYRQADILILDEPTAVLTPQEVDELFETLETFREEGKTIILITHKLREPMALCDRITVLRDGELVGTVNRKDTSREQLAEMMVGRKVVFRVAKTPAKPGAPVLQVDNLHVRDDRGLPAVRGVSFEIKAGEILGLAGVHGNGQRELVEAIWGLRKPTTGEIYIEGERITKYKTRKVRRIGVGYIPQDRQKRGLILDFSIKENLILGGQYRPPFAIGPMNSFLNAANIDDYSNHLVKDYSIRLRNIDEPVSTLSGGNQQKVIAARAMGTNPKLLLASNPTRGLDVGATEYIHNALIRMRDQGVAIFLISADLDEVRNVADRIAVIFEGKIVAIKMPEETDERELGLLMAGETEEAIAKESVR